MKKSFVFMFLLSFMACQTTKIKVDMVIDQRYVRSVQVMDENGSYMKVNEEDARKIVAFMNASTRDSSLKDTQMMRKMLAPDYQLRIESITGEQINIMMWSGALIRVIGEAWRYAPREAKDGVVGVADIHTILNTYIQKQ